MPLLTPLASLFGFAGSWLTWMLRSPLSLLFIVTIVVLSTLLIMMSSTNAPSILRSTTTSLASILRKEISSCSLSPLLTSLLISFLSLSLYIVNSMHASTMYTRPQLCLTHGFQLLRMEAVAEILKNGRFFEIQFCGKAVLHCLNTTFSPKLPHIMRVFNQ